MKAGQRSRANKQTSIGLYFLISIKMDFANEFDLSSKQLNMATTTAAPFFADPIAESLRNPKQPGAMTLSQNIFGTAFSSMFNDMRKFEDPPASMQEFITLASSIFSDTHIQTLKSRSDKFDAMAGCCGMSISDYFISTRPAIDSIKDMVWAITLYSATQSQEANPNPPPFSTAEGRQEQHERQPVTTTRQQPLLSKLRNGILGLCCLFSNLTLRTGPGAVDGHCPIQQIELEGPTILEAWCANKTTNDMEKLALSIASNANEDPSTMAYRALPVYHGTDWIVESPGTYASADPYRGCLKGACTNNQVAPTSNNVLKVIWTGFSPLRCFLWAAFQGEVLQQVPVVGSIKEAKGKLERSWNCCSPLIMQGQGGSSIAPHTHFGVTLLQFRPSLPSPHNQTHFVLPKGKETDWHLIVKANNVHSNVAIGDEAAQAKYLWNKFQGIHGGRLDTWPDVLHCREFGEQLYQLRAFTKQLWRTAWLAGKGIEELNNSYEVTYAISFKSIAPTVPPQVSSGTSIAC